MSVDSMRREYANAPLSRDDLAEDPITQFRTWFRQVSDAEVTEPNAMSLATSGADGSVTCRTVLLKAFDEKGFVFFTNYESRKARQMAENPQVSALFPWLVLARQVEIVGTVERISAADSIAYFLSRPFNSRVAAWVSHQSKVISSRNLLSEKFEEIRKRFANGEVPKPDAWGGYRIVPRSIEFWQGCESRLHDRFRYTRMDNIWKVERLSP